jgi:hypothetical protein
LGPRAANDAGDSDISHLKASSSIVRCIFEIACKKHCTALHHILKNFFKKVLKPSLHICQEIRSHYAGNNHHRYQGGQNACKPSAEKMSANRRAGVKS